MSTATTSDVITAAMSIASEAADGRLDPATLEDQAVTECRDLFGSVVGEGDPLWSLHADVARQAIALGALSADELSEWGAVMRSRAGEPVEAPVPPVDLLPGPIARGRDASVTELTDDEPDAAEAGAPVAAALAALANAAQSADAEQAEPEPPFKPQRQGDGYDPRASWSPGGSRRV